MSMLSASIFRPKFALVLSGGGAKGLAHIPILKELDRRGIVPDIVLGTSMGAVVGGFYAAGYSGEELERVVRSNDLMSYFLHLNATRDTESIQSPFTGYDTNLLTVEFGSSGIGASAGLIDDQYVNGFIRRHLSKVLSIKDFDKLSIPFRAIGADITNNRMVVFSSGSLFDAIRASMSLPVIFSPVQLEDGSYIRIKDVTLSYSLPQKALDKMRIKGLRFYVSGLNLYCFNDVNWWDPDLGPVGYGAGTYPLTKSFVGGIEVSF